MMTRLMHALSTNELVEIRLCRLMEREEAPDAQDVEELMGTSIIDSDERWRYQSILQRYLRLLGSPIKLNLEMPQETAELCVQAWLVALHRHLHELLNETVRQVIMDDLETCFHLEDLEGDPGQVEKIVDAELKALGDLYKYVRLPGYGPEELAILYEASFAAGWAKMPPELKLPRERFLALLDEFHKAGSLCWLLKAKDQHA